MCLRALYLFVTLAAIQAVAAAGAPDSVQALLEQSLKTFRTEGPKGWSFTQTTEGDGQSRVERYNAAQPEFDRWTLLQQDGRTPTTDEAQDYREKLSRRSRGGTAPRLTDQLDLTTLEIVQQTEGRAICHFRLKPGEAGDATAKYLRATIGLHQPTKTIESFTIFSAEPFAPTLGVRIASMKTTLTYSLPDKDRPSLLQRSSTQLRGRAFYLKSLDADMTVTFTHFEKAHR